jgi:plastocyanin
MRTPLMLAAAFLLSADAAAATTPPVQTIGLFSYGYDPNPIVLAAGRPVTLAFVNRSRGGHDFTAKKFFRTSRIIAGVAPGGEIDLERGQSRSVTLVPAPGRYKVHCGHPFHSLMGMKAEIIVR